MEPNQPDVRPLSRRATRIFVITAAVIAIALSIWFAFLYIESATDPESQRLREEILRREQSEQSEQAPADTP